MRNLPTIIVTGYPRTGTSMVMQMLRAVGIPLIHDSALPADKYNPNGYFEYSKLERALTHGGGRQFLQESQGHAVKVMVKHLHMLPSKGNYVAIVTERDPLVSARSRVAMGHPMNPQDSQALMEFLNIVAHWITVKFDGAHEYPVNTGHSLACFLSTHIWGPKIAAVVDPKLRHFK